jgi:hypothetical protein
VLVWIILILAVVILLAIVGSVMSRREGQGLETRGARDADRQFKRPPNEGDLL